MRIGSASADAYTAILAQRPETRVGVRTSAPRWLFDLTVKGKALQPVMRALKDWGMQWIPDRSAEPPQAHAGGRRRRPA